MNDDVFNTDRPWLFSVAYRMLGSASDAEDVLQDAWLRYRTTDPLAIRSPRAFATTIVTRLCLDHLKSARATREGYIGPWLPEPVLTSEVAGPDTTLQRSESVTLAFLVLLERLSPEERAVFLLKDVFEYGHAEIAQMLGTTTLNSRQLLHRAKARLAAHRPGPADSAESKRAIAERFARAFSAGDGHELAGLLAEEVRVWSDGGGKTAAARRPIAGRQAVLAFLVGLERAARRAGIARHVSLRIEDVNAEPALIVRVAGRLDSIYVFSIERETVAAVRIVRNPEKLARISRQLGTAH
jgi:RNA polymerase sigma-70 factor (ECF subfamily)